MSIRSTPLAVWAFIAVTVFFVGCKGDPQGFDCPEEGQDYYAADTEIGELYKFCFGSNEECRDYELSLRLYLDTVNLPPPDSNYGIVLTSIPTYGTHDRVAFGYPDTIPSEMYEQLAANHGWKASISEAQIQFCETCYTNCGLAKIIGLKGELSSVEFHYDPEDTLGIYINYSPIE
jgi:hypothetical protein